MCLLGTLCHLSPADTGLGRTAAEAGALAQSQEEGNADSQPTSNFLKVGGQGNAHAKHRKHAITYKYPEMCEKNT